MPLQSTSGAASYDAFGGGVPVVLNYIEDVFSTYLYTGNGSSQTITNNIDLSGKGGLTWIKVRDHTYENILTDTVRGATIEVVSNATYANITNTDDLTSFTSSGFSVGNGSAVNSGSPVRNYVSWTFRKQPKFFDVVTYTGNGSGAGNVINHNLGSTPGFIICKATSTTGPWAVCARTGGAASPESGITYTTGLSLNATGASIYSGTLGDFPTSTTFNATGIFDNNGNYPNVNGVTYVAYLFAHNAGGFGLTGTDNVISCGSYTANGNNTIELGYEPQFVLIKKSSGAGDWELLDTMRGMPISAGSQVLYANSSAAEGVGGTNYPTATGFYSSSYGSGTIIYIAIRRGPMKVPTSGTSVFSPIAYTGNSTTNTTVQNLTTSFAGDTTIIQQRTSGNNPLVFDKLRGSTQGLYTSLTLAEENISTARAGQSVGFNNTQTVLTGRFTNQGNYNSSGDTFVGWNFARAPSFFDEVCYLGSGTTTVRSHNLTVAPELIIFKYRNGPQNNGNWGVIHSITSTQFGKMFLDLNIVSLGPYGYADNQGLAAQPTTTTFTPSPTSSTFNTSANNYVAYLFATCAGVSKVGSYTGNGTTQTINCGFGAGGVRFVLIKRTDASGDWYVYDTARGMTVLTDPYLRLNSTGAEVATLGSVTTVATGFALNSTILAAINENGGSYIFLAIA